MKRTVLAILLGLVLLAARAQDASQAFLALKLPVSAHVGALGGENVSLVEDAPWAGWSNPSLYAGVSDKSLGLSYMSYASGSSWLGAQYVMAFGERHTAAFAAQYMGYGSMDETDEAGNVLGQFSPKDIVFSGAYSYLLSDAWAGGASLKLITSNYGHYKAIALAVDLGINYLDEEKDFSLGLTLRNVGAQLKSFDGHTERVPFNLQVGFTKGMNHLPVRISVTMTDLTRWKQSDYALSDGEKVSFGKRLLNHFVVGLYILPTESIYLSVGYNFRRAYELKAAGSGHGAGITAGAGLNLKKFKFGATYARYHKSTSALMFNAGYSF